MSINLSGSLVLTGSLVVTGEITMSGSIASASYAVNATSASYAANATTASYAANATTASYAANATSASYALTATSASFAGNTVLFANRDSLTFASTGSNIFVGNQTITGSILGSGSLSINGCIVSTGAIIAQTINVQQVTSSIVYSCGSNIFGTSISNTQQLTGSVGITGSLTIAGASSATSYSGATIFGSTIACSPIGCFATSCATAFIGGTLSGTTLYGSTAICSPVGKFTTCIDAGSGTFSDNVLISKANILSSLTIKSSCSTTGLQLYLYGLNATLSNQDNGSLVFQTNGNDRLTISSTGASTFACSVTADGGSSEGSIRIERDTV